MEILLDALAALRLLEKSADTYALQPGLEHLLAARGRESVLAMVQHQATCMRRWVQLARVVKTGRPAECLPSLRGEGADLASFIGAMHNVSKPVAEEVIQGIQPLRFERLLDVGGGPGTWTAAFLRRCPVGRAVLFDLPDVVPIARQHLRDTDVVDRVEFVSGDYRNDPLPEDVDLAWVSAIIHQNSRAQNRQLFAKVFQSLTTGGRIAIRDILMAPSRTEPTAGALFAINMLVGTEAGGTFTFEEVRQDLEAAGFGGVSVARTDPGMNSIVVGIKGDQGRGGD